MACRSRMVFSEMTVNKAEQNINHSTSFCSVILLYYLDVCHLAAFHSVQCHSSECHLDVSHLVACHYAECHSAECHYSE
jgi:hypothetical protein